MNHVDDFMEGFKEPEPPPLRPDQAEALRSVFGHANCSPELLDISAQMRAVPRLTSEQRAFLDSRLGASLVTLASDFRQQFNTTAEQTCSLMNQWANS